MANATIGQLNVILALSGAKYAKGLKQANTKTKKFGRTVKTTTVSVKALGSSMVNMLAGAVGLAALSRAVKNINDLNQAMQSSQAIMTGLTRTMRTDMKEAAIEVAKSTKFSATEAAESFFFLASAGLDAKQSLAALPFVSKFAQAGMFNMALATDLLTDAQSALGLTVKDAAQNLVNMRRVADILVKSNTLANASVQQFSESLTNKVGAALRFVNKDLEEGAAVLAAFADQGTKGADAGTALNIVFRELQTKSIQNRAAFDKLGVGVFDAAGEMRNIADIVEDLETAFGDLSPEMKKTELLQLGLQDKSISFIATLIGTSDKIREYERALRDAGGTTEKVADKQLTKLTAALNELHGSFSEVGDTMTTFNEGPLAENVSNFSRGLTFIAKWIKGLDGIVVATEVLGAAWNVTFAIAAGAVAELTRALALPAFFIDKILGALGKNSDLEAGIHRAADSILGLRDLSAQAAQRNLEELGLRAPQLAPLGAPGFDVAAAQDAVRARSTFVGPMQPQAEFEQQQMLEALERIASNTDPVN